MTTNDPVLNLLNAAAVLDAAANLVERLARQGSGYPVHLHTCSDPAVQDGMGSSHRWPCQSPYCPSLNRVCPMHGGKKPRTLEDDSDA